MFHHGSHVSYVQLVTILKSYESTYAHYSHILFVTNSIGMKYNLLSYLSIRIKEFTLISNVIIYKLILALLYY